MQSFSTWLAHARRHWLAPAVVLLYLLRWAQYVGEAAAYRALPTSGGPATP
jgi:hypothetical protein